jgi:hypothetical protein
MKSNSKAQRPKYLLYATILDAFQDYLRSSEIWQEYYGNSEEPSISEEEFEKKQFQSLIDRINRVPFDSEKADRGTAFGEVVDCIIENRNSDKMEIKSNKESGQITVIYNNRTFVFPISLCVEFATYFKGAATQFYVEAPLSTKYGHVLLYGYIDELMPISVHDIKTTEKYKAGKYRHGWQHIVYPYCLNYYGNLVQNFEYNIVQFAATSYSTFIEYYNYVKGRDIPKLTAHVEQFIEFLEQHRELITDLKIFNLKPELV